MFKEIPIMSDWFPRALSSFSSEKKKRSFPRKFLTGIIRRLETPSFYNGQEEEDTVPYPVISFLPSSPEILLFSAVRHCRN